MLPLFFAFDAFSPNQSAGKPVALQTLRELPAPQAIIARKAINVSIEKDVNIDRWAVSLRD